MKVNKQPTDSPNIIYVITEQKQKRTHKLETKYGLLNE